MIPAKYKIEIWRGGTWTIGIQQDTIDFASYDEIRMQIRPSFLRKVPTEEALFTLALSNGRVTLEESGQVLRLTISAADTASLSFDEGVYDLEMVKYVDLTAVPPIPEEIVDKLLYGKVLVYKEQTV